MIESGLKHGDKAWIIRRHFSDSKYQIIIPEQIDILYGDAGARGSDHKELYGVLPREPGKTDRFCRHFRKTEEIEAWANEVDAWKAYIEILEEQFANLHTRLDEAYAKVGELTLART